MIGVYSEKKNLPPFNQNVLITAFNGIVQEIANKIRTSIALMKSKHTRSLFGKTCGITLLGKYS